MTKKDAKDAVITARLPLDIREKLVNRARQSGISLSTLICDYLTCVIDEQVIVERINHNVDEVQRLAHMIQEIRERGLDLLDGSER